MNWITNYVRPKISSLLATRDVPENLWIKCPETGEMVFHKDLEANQWVVPSSGHHMRIRAVDRLDAFFDNGDYELIELPKAPADPLKFRDSKRYTDRLREYRTKADMQDAVLVAKGKVEGLALLAIVQDFAFMGGSLGMAAGEAIVKGFDTAREEALPVVLFAASGGARMQEGILSLMQLPRTTVALDMLKEAGLPYIVVLTNPTAGGVTASYAMLGDVHIAEPGAVIGFAGARVIEQTIRERLPEGFQRAEYLMEHGMVDTVVHRHELKATIARLLKVFTHAPGDLATVPAETAPSRDEPVVLAADGAVSKAGQAAAANGAASAKTGEPEIAAASSDTSKRASEKSASGAKPSADKPAAANGAASEAKTKG